MRNFAYLSLFVFMFSCGSVSDAIKNLLSFDISEEIPEQTIDGNGLPCSAPEILGITLFKMPPITITQQEHFPDQGTKVNLIKDARLTKFSLSKKEISTEENFDWLSSLTIYAEAEGLEKLKIASIDPVAEDQLVLNFIIEDVNLVSFIKADKG